MSELVTQLKGYVETGQRRYNSLSDSERLIANAVTLVVALALIFLLVIAPAQRSVNAAEAKLVGQQGLLQWMQENEGLAREASRGGSRSPRSNQPLQTIVTATAPRLGVAIKRLEPESGNRLRIWVEKVPFDNTMTWLNQLEERHGVTVNNISVDSEREPGLVTAKMVLQK